MLDVGARYYGAPVVKTRAVRREPSPAADSLVVRGLLGASGPTAHELEANALLDFDVYGYFGISVWVATSLGELAALERGRLSSFEQYSVMRVADVTSAGLDLWPTGLDPHYDVVRGAGDDVNDLVSRFLQVPRQLSVNAHIDREGD